MQWRNLYYFSPLKLKKNNQKLQPLANKLEGYYVAHIIQALTNLMHVLIISQKIKIMQWVHNTVSRKQLSSASLIAMSKLIIDTHIMILTLMKTERVEPRKWKTKMTKLKSPCKEKK